MILHRQDPFLEILTFLVVRVHAKLNSPELNSDNFETIKLRYLITTQSPHVNLSIHYCDRFQKV